MNYKALGLAIATGILAVTTALTLAQPQSNPASSAYVDTTYKDAEVGWAEFYPQNGFEKYSGGEKTGGGVPSGLHTLKVYTHYPSEGGELLYEEPVYLAGGYDYYIDIHKNHTTIERINTEYGVQYSGN